jgi:hypothetical protein
MQRHKLPGNAFLAFALGTTALSHAQAESSPDLETTSIEDERARLEGRVATARIAVMQAFETMMKDADATGDTLAQWYNWPNWNNFYNQWRNW